MKKLSFFLMAMLFSVMSFAEVVILDGSKLTSTATTTDSEITQSGFTYTLSKGAKQQAVQAGNINAFTGVTQSILIGKSGAYIYNTTPFGNGITKFEIYSNKGASAKVSVSVSFSETEITNAKGTPEFAQKLSTVDQVYTIENIPANAKYFYYTVTNANNSQVVFRITYEPENSNPDAVKYTITTAVNDENMGSVIGGGSVEEGKTTTLTAYPKPGYEFVKWNDESTDNPRTITVTEDATYTAIFQAQTPITCSQIKDLAIGDAFVLGEFTVTYVNGSYTYIKDATGASLIYASNYGLKAGDVVTGLAGTRANYNGLVQITPSVTKAQLTITAGTAPQPEVMTADPTKDDMNKYVKFEKVQFSSTAFSSQNIKATIVGQTTQFAVRDQWKTNNTFVKGGTYEFIGAVSYYNAVQVNFISATKVSLTISATATGGKVTGTGEYMEGDEATLIATANEGYEFVNWTWADEVVCTTPEYTFEVEEAMSLVANFAKKTYTVTATAENGSVAGLAADGKYEHGAEANLTATAAEGYEFTCWTSGEDTVSTANPYKFTVTADVALVANFKEVEPEIEWMKMDLEITNLVTEVMEVGGAKFLQLMGRDDMNDADVTLFLNNYADVDDDYVVNAESSYMTFGGTELTVLEGTMTQTSETEKGTIYTGTVRASAEEEGETMYLEFTLTMYAAPATVLVLTDAIVAINEELGTLTFNVPTGEGEGEGYYAELANYTAPGVHQGPQICLFATPEVVSYTNYAETSVADGIITLKGEFTSLNGPKFNLTISGKLPGSATALDNLNTTVAPVKAIINGQLIIINNGVQYNAQGQVIK